jgi:hypothetical protein
MQRVMSFSKRIGVGHSAGRIKVEGGQMVQSPHVEKKPMEGRHEAGPSLLRRLGATLYWLLGPSGVPFNGAQDNRLSAGIGERSPRSRGFPRAER